MADWWGQDGVSRDSVTDFLHKTPQVEECLRASLRSYAREPVRSCLESGVGEMECSQCDPFQFIRLSPFPSEIVFDGSYGWVEFIALLSRNA